LIAKKQDRIVVEQLPRIHHTFGGEGNKIAEFFIRISEQMDLHFPV
jgi:hypothetical protein